MDVKVKALVRMRYGSCYNEGDSLIIDYTYKIRGFRKQGGYIYLESKKSGESYDNFTDRAVKRLESLSHDEVIELTKKRVSYDVGIILKDKSNDERLKSLLKDFNKINFTFKVKEKL